MCLLRLWVGLLVGRGGRLVLVLLVGMGCCFRHFLESLPCD